jgi:hypothetical protein
MHPYIAPTDKVDGLLKIANDTGQEGCWPSEKEMESVGLADHETIYHVEIVNHSQRTLASGRVAFGLKYNVGVKNGGCMAPPGVQFDQEDIVLIPPLEPGKSFDFFAVNQTNRCAWLVLPHSATVKWYGDNGNSDATLTFDKNPLYAAGAPVFPPTMINWEGVPSKPGGYGIVRTGVRACEHNPASTSPRRRHVLEEQNDRVLEEVSVVLYNDANDPAFSVDDKSMNPARYASGIATFRLPKGTHRIRAEYATRTCSLTFSLPLSEPGPVPANCRLKTGG